MIIHKRRLFALFICCIVFMLSACTGNTQNTVKKDDETALRVRYLNLVNGNGDCSIISFPNGKTMVIDFGESEKDYDLINTYIGERIDYIFLTHLHSDRLGSLNKIVSNHTVGKAYFPLVNNKSAFPVFNQAYTGLVDKGTDIITTEIGKKFTVDNVFVYILSPLPYGVEGSGYNDFNLAVNPTDEEINNCSPVIYIKYLDFSFLFCGDMSISYEKIFINNYNAKSISRYIGEDISLGNIDFYKVPRHGGSGACSTEFLELIKPKNAVISVNGNNIDGNPNTNVLERLYLSNKYMNIYRTDVNGNITVKITPSGKCSVVIDNR